MSSLENIYDRLLEHYGGQDWWPAESKFEVMVGAVLTQNVNWKNVEKAIDNLKENDLLSPRKLLSGEEQKIREIIKPSGFYRQKTKRLRRISQVIKKNEGLERFFERYDLSELRGKLLDIKGIGPETADSIILYAAEKTTFVVDAYTMRILKRVDGIEGGYQHIKSIFEKELEEDLDLFQEYHALLVKLGKDHCKTEPECERCPLSEICDLKNGR